MDEDEFVLLYRQLQYAIGFDAIRKNLEEKDRFYMPL